MLDTSRVAEVIVSGAAKDEYGSGYRIAKRLVLTVDHLLEDAGADPTCLVLLGGDPTPLPATPVWRGGVGRSDGGGRDLALLRLDAFPADDEGEIVPVSFGELPGSVGSVPFVGIGFPSFATRDEEPGVKGLRRRESRKAEGRIHLGSNLKSRLLDLQYTTAAPAGSGGGDDDPWRGMSGAAFFTPHSGLLVGVQAHRLPRAGIASAEAEPIADALTDPAFRRQLALLGGVSAETLDVAHGDEQGEPEPLLRAVLPQHELISGFGDFKKNLTSEQLTFVSPGEHHPAEPSNLFVRLLEAGDRGVLLVGAAGTGKTRAGIEVGRIALAAGWRVLHVLPGEDGSVTDLIAEQVFAEPTPALVVVDYLNESQLDLPALRHRLIPEARRRKSRVAILASVRPGWLKKANKAQLHSLFDEVELRQDDAFQKEVADHALWTLAPEATTRHGIARMREICGHRPIVALLVAREVERRFTSGLTLPESSGLREGGEIPRWLRSRLDEDDLAVPKREHAFIPARATHSLVAAAAVTAACPQPREEVTEAARAALAAYGPPVPAADGTVPVVPRAEQVVTTLLSLGWLEPDPETDNLSVAHDLVTDQLVESVLLPERNEAPDTEGTQALLASCLVSPRGIGRAAVNLGRVVNDLALVDRAGPVSTVLNSWFVQNASALGAVLRLDASLGSYALGSVCSGAPWSTVAVQCWAEVVGPWLADWGHKVAARHMLYRGLHHLPEEGTALLLPTVASWLSRNGKQTQASFVLAPLLHRTDSGTPAGRDAITSALTWLDLNIAAQEAQFVLNPLLFRPDVPPEAAKRATARALEWLETDGHGATEEAGFVLDPLLNRDDLDEDSLRKAVAHALAWLGPHARTQGARFVLNPLLSRSDLDETEATKAITIGLGWLRENGETQEARFVLNRMLSRGDIDLVPDAASTAISTALAWAGTYNHTSDADFVLRVLLSRTDLAPEQAATAIECALVWLRPHHVNQDADFVLGSLLKQLPRGEVPEEVVVMVDTWVAANTPAQDFTFLSKWILRQRMTSPTIYRALLHWAHTNPDNPDLVPRIAGTSFHVGPYIATWEGARDFLRTVELCLDHAERHGPPSNVNGVLDALISSLPPKFRTGVGAAWADDCIRRWLALPFVMDPTVFRHNDGIVPRVNAVLFRGGYTPAERERIARRLRAWVAAWPDPTRNTAALAFIDTYMLPPRAPVPVPPPRPSSDSVVP